MDSYSVDSKVKAKKSCQGGQWVGCHIGSVITESDGPYELETGKKRFTSTDPG